MQIITPPTTLQGNRTCLPGWTASVVFIITLLSHLPGVPIILKHNETNKKQPNEKRAITFQPQIGHVQIVQTAWIWQEKSFRSVLLGIDISDKTDFCFRTFQSLCCVTVSAIAFVSIRATVFERLKNNQPNDIVGLDRSNTRFNYQDVWFIVSEAD